MATGHDSHEEIKSVLEPAPAYPAAQRLARLWTHPQLMPCGAQPGGAVLAVTMHPFTVTSGRLSLFPEDLGAL